MSTPLETRIESRFVKYVKNAGLFAFKLNPFGMRGIPDRLVLTGHGKAIFIEFKRMNKEPRKNQTHFHKILERMGYGVYWTDSYQEAVEIFEYERAHAATMASGGREVSSRTALRRTTSSSRSGEDPDNIHDVRGSQKGKESKADGSGGKAAHHHKYLAERKRKVGPRKQDRNAAREKQGRRVKQRR